MKRFFGWKADLPDHRDLIYKLQKNLTIPTKMDLRSKCPPVYDQGELGSCTANAIAGAIEFDQIKQKYLKPFVPSRLFIYYNERVIENTVKSDSGAEIRDGIKSVVNQGACSETTVSYDITKFEIKPPAKAYTEASKYQAVKYERLTDINSYKNCLAAGNTFVFGFSVYESFESDAVAKTGIVPMPKKTEKLLGGHAVQCVGYDDTKKAFIVRNSWGANWGDKGYFYLPYSYFTSSLTDDFWTIYTIEQGN